MKSGHIAPPAKEKELMGFPGTASLAALRAWYAGLNARAALAQYLGQDKVSGQSSRAMLGETRRQLARYARARHREDLAVLIEHRAAERMRRSRAVLEAIETLRHLVVPTPQVTDDVERWLPVRAARAIKAHGFRTLAQLTVRIPRRRRWWSSIPGLGATGATGARQIEAFIAAHPQLTASARLCPSAHSTTWCHGNGSMCRTRSMDLGERFARLRPLPPLTPTTTTRRFRLGCRFTKPPPPSARTARRPSD